MGRQREGLPKGGGKEIHPCSLRRRIPSIIPPFPRVSRRRVASCSEVPSSPPPAAPYPAAVVRLTSAHHPTPASPPPELLPGLVTVRRAMPTDHHEAYLPMIFMRRLAPGKVYADYSLYSMRGHLRASGRTYVRLNYRFRLAPLPLSLATDPRGARETAVTLCGKTLGGRESIGSREDAGKPRVECVG